jgi:hypothetical protein
MCALTYEQAGDLAGLLKAFANLNNWAALTIDPRSICKRSKPLFIPYSLPTCAAPNDTCMLAAIPF